MSAAIALERRPASSVVRDYLELSKARIVFMILITTGAGYLLAEPFSWAILAHVLIGTALVAGGTNALNQCWEHGLDARMARTKRRPLPAGRITLRAAIAYSVSISVVGIAYLAVAVNPLSALIAFITLVSYVFIYTPMKTRSTFCTLVGALPGAMPPLIGWAGATGALATPAWLMFGIMFLWQLPHFLAISWIYRDDYARAGFEMTSVHDGDGKATGRHAVGYSIALLTFSMLPALLGLGTVAYFAGALLAGGALLWIAGVFAATRTIASARKLFMVSNIYLLVIMALMLVGRVS
ncbi:MAG: protoheme IX farnesyltransferase [Acidobacteria bacterium]|nr:protoheme IX farnesyltransferase [Acidobacteriota bacterium]